MDTLCVIGLGYIGLPTAALFASNGVQVTGVDIDPDIVNTVAQGQIHIEEEGLADLVKRMIASETLTVSTEPCIADAYIIAVPTPVNDNNTADMRAVESATRSILPYLKPGCLVVLESTSPPGTTNKLIASILAESNLEVGKEIYLAYSPERVLPGKILTELVSNDRVVGGVNEESTAKARSLYNKVVQGVIHESDSTTAEAVKLMENSFRDANIAIANEFALIAEELEINVWSAIKLANKHPRVNILTPGPGVGGHCIAVDPHFLIESAPEQAKMLTTARQVNNSMPHHVVDKIKKTVKHGAKICGLGITFKPDVDDVRESPALEILRDLKDEGFDVSAYDPHASVSELKMPAKLEQACEGAEMVVLLVSHKEFAQLSPSDLNSVAEKTVFDTRNVLNHQQWQNAGFEVHLLGSGHKVRVSTPG